MSPHSDSAARKAPIAAVSAISHVAIEVSELEASIAFYAETLGFEIFRDDRSSRPQPSVKGVIAGFGVELAQAKRPERAGRRPSGTPPGSPTLSFTVTNIDAAFEALKARGLVEAERPTALHGAKFFYVYDPDGQAIELIQFPAPIGVLADLRALQR